MTNALRSKEFKAGVYSEGSWGASALSPEADHVMELHQTGVDRYMIEWTCDELDVYETIGIWTEDNKLTDYDGVMSLPKEAAELLREHGIEVSDDFL
jgi:hypothetical protein